MSIFQRIKNIFMTRNDPPDIGGKPTTPAEQATRWLLTEGGLLDDLAVRDIPG